MNSEHFRKLDREFSRQAPHFDMPTHSIASRKHLEWILQNLSLSETDTVLDVAAGTALLGRALAPRVKKVIALEATDSMANQGRIACERQGITNVEFRKGYAESLPFGDGHFDLVACRLALHHFVDAAVPIREMIRVVKAGGMVALIDLLSPDDSTVALTYNKIEQMRDPSHIRALGREELLTLTRAAGLSIAKVDTRTIEIDGETWLSFTGCSKEKKDAIMNYWASETVGGAETGMRPTLKGSDWKFYQRWMIVNGVKH